MIDDYAKKPVPDRKKRLGGEVWDFKTPPTKEYINESLKSEYTEYFGKGTSLGEWSSMFNDFSVKTYDDLKTLVSLPEDSAKYKAFEKRYKAVDAKFRLDKSVSDADVGIHMEYTRYVNSVKRMVLLDNHGYTGNLKVTNMKQGTSGVSVVFREESLGPIGTLPTLMVPYEAIDVFLDAWSGNPKGDKTRLKRSREYKEWAAQGGDPKLKSAVDTFKKVVGLDISTYGTRSGMKTIQLRADYVKKVQKIFEEVQGVVDMRLYNPPDGKELKVKIGGVGVKNHVAGMYTEKYQTITISPTMPGTVTHELGHYFWNRHKDLQNDFLKWAKESGFTDKMLKTLNTKPSMSEVINHVDTIFNVDMKKVFEFVDNQTKGMDDSQRQSLKDYLFMSSNIVRLKMIEDYAVIHNNSANAYMATHMMSWISGQSDKEIEKVAWGLSNNFSEVCGNRSEGEVLDILRSAKRTLNDNKFKSLKSLDLFLKGMCERAMFDDPNKYFKKEANYFVQPTEAFARSFRTYLAKQAGLKEFKTSKEQAEAMGYKGQKENSHGWGFPEVDPDYSMFDDGQFGSMLKRHIGSTIIKSMVGILVSLSKAKSYPDGTIRKWKGGTVRKEGGEWVPVKGEVPGKTDSISRKITRGSTEMYEALGEVSSGDVYIDDLKDRIKTFNTLTKMGLITWEHTGHGEEYVAKLTDKGVQEYTRAKAVSRVKERSDDAEKLNKALEDWVQGAAVMPVRAQIRLSDGTYTEGEAHGSIEGDTEKWKGYADVILGNVRSIDADTLYRGTDNKRWAYAENGDEIPFGAGSFSKKDSVAKYFGMYMLKVTGKSLQGVDVGSVSSGLEPTSRLRKSEDEVILRATHLKVVNKTMTRIEKMGEMQRVVIIEVEPVVSEMRKGSKMPGNGSKLNGARFSDEKRGNTSTEDKKALLEALSDDFNNPLHKKVK